MNTDCKLITNALIYAEDSPTGIFSSDLPLLETFAYAAKCFNLPIKKTFILNENLERRIPTSRYLSENVSLNPYIYKSKSVYHYSRS